VLLITIAAGRMPGQGPAARGTGPGSAGHLGVHRRLSASATAPAPEMADAAASRRMSPRPRLIIRCSRLKRPRNAH
jgi:hypothetical protein